MTGEGRGTLENTIHAQKRFAALIAVVASSNNKVATNMKYLTWVTIGIGIIQIVLAILSLLTERG